MLTSGVYLIILYIVSLVRSPRFMDVSKQKATYDKSGLSHYIWFLLAVLVGATVLGYTFTHNTKSVVEIGGTDLVLSGLIGVNLFLLRFKNKAKQ